MPRVEKDAEVSICVLVYRSLAWLDWCMQGVDTANQTNTKYRWHVVSNDGTPEVESDPRISVHFRNDNPKAFYIENVYRAWNEAVLTAPTELVVLMNDDMFPFHGWLDALVAAKVENPKTVPTSLLIESGRVPSGMPELVKNHGMNPDEFNLESFYRHAAAVGKRGTEPGRLYMPILLDRQEFSDIGKYPEGNPPGTTGDKDLIRRYEEAGFKHVTVNGSVVYHCVQGEQFWP